MESSFTVLRMTENTTYITGESSISVIDILTITISAIAIIISIWSVLHSNKSQYNNKFYDNILRKTLQKRMPKLINETIDVNNMCLNENAYEKLNSFIGKFRRDIIVFKYENEKFYNKMDGKLINIDELLVLLSIDRENFCNNYDKLLGEIKNLYKIVRKYIL